MGSEGKRKAWGLISYLKVKFSLPKDSAMETCKGNEICQEDVRRPSGFDSRVRCSGKTNVGGHRQETTHHVIQTGLLLALAKNVDAFATSSDLPTTKKPTPSYGASLPRATTSARNNRPPTRPPPKRPTSTTPSRWTPSAKPTPPETECEMHLSPYPTIRRHPPWPPLVSLSSTTTKNSMQQCTSIIMSHSVPKGTLALASHIKTFDVRGIFRAQSSSSAR